MPPPADDPDTTADAPGEAPPTLHDASARLEAALARLEALVDTGPLQSELFRSRETDGVRDDAVVDDGAAALKAELAAGRARERALQAAASLASDTLGRAMAQIRQALEAEEDEHRGDGGDGGGLDPALATAEDAAP